MKIYVHGAPGFEDFEATWLFDSEHQVDDRGRLSAVQCDLFHCTEGGIHVVPMDRTHLTKPEGWQS